MLKRTLGVSLISTACLLFGLTSPNAAQAAPPDYICYMQIGSQIVDLTRSVCKFDAKKVARTAAANAAYLSSVKELLKSKDNFLELINSNPELVVVAAQNYCAARQSGVSEQQYVESQREELMRMSTLSETSLTDDDSKQMKQYETAFMATTVAVEFAPKYYCPGVIHR